MVNQDIVLAEEHLMIAKEHRQSAALERFAQANPELLEEIAGLDAREQAQQIAWAFEDQAQSKGLEAWEYALELIAESPQALASMRLETHQEVAQALGLEWEEYCGFNELDPAAP